MDTVCSPLSVLILEDNLVDADILTDVLAYTGIVFNAIRVDNETDFNNQLGENPDLILADYSLPQFNALQALETLQARGLDIPFIVVTGALGDEEAAACIKKGATDYLLKDRLARVGQAIQQALDSKALREAKLQTELALQASEARLRGILDSTREAVISINERQEILLFNRGAAQIFGYSPEEAIGQSINMLIPETFHATHRQHIVDFGKSNVNAYLMAEHRPELRGRRKNSDEFPVEASISRLKEENGEYLFTVILRDITDRNQVEQARDDLIQMIVHDMKNPIALIRGYTEIALSEISPDQEIFDFINKVYHASNYLLDMTMMILDTGRLEEGKLILDPTPRRVLEILGEVKEAMEYMASSREVSLEIRCPEEDLTATLDWGLIRRVVANLANNAIKYSPPGTTVTLSTFKTNFPEPCTCISVADQGEGIAAEDQERVFEKFTQASHRKGGSRMDTGLGLTFCKLAAEAHGGSVQLESAAGAGATFTVIIPDKDNPPSLNNEITGIHGRAGEYGGSSSMNRDQKVLSFAK